MKHSCSYCGRVHEYGFQCPKKPKPAAKERNDLVRFRSGKLWRVKANEILERDKGLCVVCRLGLCGEPADLVPASSVHHIIPLAVDFDRRLDNDNLVSLCGYHHERAECGDISAEDLLRAVANLGE